MGAQINIKQGYDQRLKARMDERALLGQATAHHWPFESLVFAYAVACVDIVLLHSDKANTIYNEIREAWGLPGCQALISGFRDCLPVTNAWKAKAFKARGNGELFPDLPSEWFDTYFKHAPAYLEGEPHNTDYEYSLERMDMFILAGFNRQVDQENETWKVIPDTSPWLKSVIILRSQAEYAKMKLEDLRRYRPARIDGKPYGLNAIMADKPTAGTERQIYRKLVKVYKDYGFTLKHDAKLLKDADRWYKCRVDPGSIELYIRDESERINQQAQQLSNQELESYYLKAKTNKLIDRIPDRGRIENDIAACDEATGYPRKWRK